MNPLKIYIKKSSLKNVKLQVDVIIIKIKETKTTKPDSNNKYIYKIIPNKNTL